MFFNLYFLTHFLKAIENAMARAWECEIDINLYHVSGCIPVDLEDGGGWFITLIQGDAVTMPVTAYILESNYGDCDQDASDMMGVKEAADVICLPEEDETKASGLLVIINQREPIFLTNAFLGVEEPTEHENEPSKP